MKNSEQQEQAREDDLAGITRHAHEEIVWVHKAYFLAATIIGVIIVFGIYFTYQKAEDFKNEIKDEGRVEQDRMNKDVSLMEQKLKQDMQSQADQVRREVAKRIDDEFASSNIVVLVHDQAKERIGAIADVLIQKDIANQITPIHVEFLALLSTNKADEKLQI